MGTFDQFDDDPLAAALNAPVTAPKQLPEHYKPAHFERCPKCDGTGQFRSNMSGRVLGQCFACKGKGGRTFKTSAADRAKAKDRRVNKHAAQIEAFRTEHKAIAAWLDTEHSFPFAVAMRDALSNYGRLTDNQVAACYRCISGKAVASEKRKTAAPSMDVTRLQEAFDHARDNASRDDEGILHLGLRLDTFRFSPAGARSKNAGSIYVKEGDQYLGKVTDGKFFASRDCTPEQTERILAAAADPEAAAIAYGQRFKECSCCGRTLTNAESRERGIGPICAEKYGW